MSANHRAGQKSRRKADIATEPLTRHELEAIVDALTEILAGPDERDITHEVYDRALDKVAAELVERKRR